MIGRLIESDPILKRKIVLWQNSDATEFTLETKYDVRDIVEMNKASHAAVDERERHGDMTRYASIPIQLMQQMQSEGKLDDQPYMRRWLNDRDNLFWRTRHGKV